MTKKYRIKHESVEKAVRGLFKTQEAYEEALNNSCRIKVPYAEDRLICVHGHVSVTGSYCDVHVAVSNIEEVVEYDPKVWNDYSKVKPPKDDCYRVQMTLPDFEVRRFMLEWRDGKWRVDYLPEHQELLFKPWDD